MLRCSEAFWDLIRVKLVVDESPSGSTNGESEEVVEEGNKTVVDNIPGESSVGFFSGDGVVSVVKTNPEFVVEEVNDRLETLVEGNSGTPRAKSNDETIGQVSVGVVELVSSGKAVVIQGFLEVHGEIVRHGDKTTSKKEP